VLFVVILGPAIMSVQDISKPKPGASAPAK
jgi:hypothetical protein